MVVVGVTVVVGVNDGVGEVVGVEDSDLEGFAVRLALREGVLDFDSLTEVEVVFVGDLEGVPDREIVLEELGVSLIVGVSEDEGETGEAVLLVVVDLLGDLLVDGVDEGVPPDEGVGVCVGLGDGV